MRNYFSIYVERLSVSVPKLFTNVFLDSTVSIPNSKYISCLTHEPIHGGGTTIL